MVDTVHGGIFELIAAAYVHGVLSLFFSRPFMSWNKVLRSYGWVQGGLIPYSNKHIQSALFLSTIQQYWPWLGLGTSVFAVRLMFGSLNSRQFHFNILSSYLQHRRGICHNLNWWKPFSLFADCLYWTATTKKLRANVLLLETVTNLYSWKCWGWVLNNRISYECSLASGK